mmetsp:Transcript_137022/g.273292  ORF Transcript_137022/g.273292 Transcript_137022/m.273292 type:complete len:112 (-) Transcript_137022:3-338(-)
MTSFPGSSVFFFRKSDKKWTQADAGRFGRIGSTVRLAKPVDQGLIELTIGNDMGKLFTGMPPRHKKPQGKSVLIGIAVVLVMPMESLHRVKPRIMTAMTSQAQVQGTQQRL